MTLARRQTQIVFSAAVCVISLMLGIFRPAVAGQAADPWVGTYEYTHLIGTMSGIRAPITYTLTVRAGTGSKSATLKAQGYQTDDEIICDTKTERAQLQVYFRSYPDGGTNNQYGVELYKTGAPLLTLVRRGEQLITQWQEYNAEAAQEKREGVQFRRSSTPHPK